MQIARTVSTRATCPRAAVGCVLMREHRILTTGYNGAPRGVAHCLEVGCTWSTTIASVPRMPKPMRSFKARSTASGCPARRPTARTSRASTARSCSSVPASEIVYETAYPDPIASQLLAEAGVAVAFSGPDGDARVSRRSRCGPILHGFVSRPRSRRPGDAASCGSPRRLAWSMRSASGACTTSRNRASAASRCSSASAFALFAVSACR